MLYFDINFDTSEGIDINKTNASKECGILPYWYFSDKEFKFQPDVCYRCHDVLMMSMNLSCIAILNNNGVNYRCISNRIAKVRQ